MASKKASSKRIFVLILILLVAIYLFVAHYVPSLNLPGGNIFYSIFLAIFNQMYGVGETASSSLDSIMLNNISAFIFAIVLFFICFLPLKLGFLKEHSLFFVIGIIVSVLIMISTLIGGILPQFVEYIDATGKLLIGVIKNKTQRRFTFEQINGFRKGIIP